MEVEEIILSGGIFPDTNKRVYQKEGQIPDFKSITFYQDV